MTTDNRLLESIINSGKEQATAITDEAEKKAKEVISAAEIKAGEEAEAIKNDADVKALNMKNSALSSASLIERNAVLSAKRNEIDKTLDGIVEYINALEDEKYFAILYKMARQLDEKSGTVMLCERDLNRLPSDFEAKLKEAGIDAEISKESVDINGGFILRSGEIESNCSLSAVIEDRKNELEDFINRLLFTGEN